MNYVKEQAPLHIHQNIHQQWVVRRENQINAMQVFPTEIQAENWAMKRADGKVEIVIHNRDGTVKEIIKPRTS